jgi:hypothetical protein
MIDKRSWRTMQAYRLIRVWGGVSGAKSDSEAQSAEKTSVGFQKTLMNMFQTQFGKQSQILNFISGKMTSQIANPQGFTPQTMAAMNTQATEGVANQFTQANTAAKEMEAQQGGNGLPSGVQAQITGQNANAAAQTEAGAQNQIQIANAQQQQQNYWNAVNTLSGTAAQENPNGLISGANTAGEDVAGLSQAVSQSQKSGFTNTLSGAFASSLGKGLGSAATLGVGSVSGLSSGGGSNG